MKSEAQLDERIKGLEGRIKSGVSVDFFDVWHTAPLAIAVAGWQIKERGEH